MSRYIDADAYAAEMKTRQDACLELMNAAREMDNEKMYGQKSAAFSVFVEAKLTLDAMPTIDAVPVVHGYNTKDDSPSLFGCSVCGWFCLDTYCGDTDTYNYCPNCGAKMDGERKDVEHE